ncbi:hypothetical protein AURDEDRAFT_161263 [Auricularia subglabra TFB-10046 SS5]|nr:hypothetical protein AURDEDRAFT_161263 [Auricularia subglabra TFB-10046 SS5]
MSTTDHSDSPDVDDPQTEEGPATAAEPTFRDMLLTVARGANERDNSNGFLNTMAVIHALLVAQLEPYYPHNVHQFLRTLLLCHGVISGSWALWFILQAVWVANDMDIVVPFGNGLPYEFLLMCGYTLVREFGTTSMADGTFRMIRHVYTWVHTDLGKKVDVLVSMSDNVVDVVKHFHSTIVQNFISPLHIVVMHPIQSFKLISLYSGVLVRRVRRKYRARGITFIKSNANDTIECGPSCPSIIRGAMRPDTYLSVPLVTAYAIVESPLIPFWASWTGPFECENATCPNCTLRVQDVLSDNDGDSSSTGDDGSATDASGTTASGTTDEISIQATASSASSQSADEDDLAGGDDLAGEDDLSEGDLETDEPVSE